MSHKIFEPGFLGPCDARHSLLVHRCANMGDEPLIPVLERALRFELAIEKKVLHGLD